MLFEAADETNARALTNTSIPTARHFFAVVNTIYDNVFTILRQEENTKIIELRNAWYDIFFSIGEKDKELFKKVFRLYVVAERMYQLVIAYLQAKQYFFRIGSREDKGIEAAIKVIEQGGGIFGKKLGGLPILDGKEHETSSEVDKPLRKNA